MGAVWVPCGSWRGVVGRKVDVGPASNEAGAAGLAEERIVMMTAVVTRPEQRTEPEIGPIQEHEMDEAIGVLARGMRDNPTHVAVYGNDPAVRQDRVAYIFSQAARRFTWHEHAVAARDAEGAIVGVCGMMPPGACLPNPADKMRMLPSMLRLGFGTSLRIMQWLGTWAKHDPDTLHWHLGPLAVDAHLQGQGIGSDLMRVFCARMDAAGEDAYLETDKAINVRFYQKFGFEVIGEEAVLGVPSWFMLRRANTPRP